MSIFGKATAQLTEMPEVDVPGEFEIPPKAQWGFTPPLRTLVGHDGLSGQIMTGTALSPSVTLHHEAHGAEFSIQRPVDYGQGIVLEFGEFTGSFFSLAFEVPEDAVKALSRQDLLRISIQTQTDEPFEAYARLNLKYGPNTAQIVRMIKVGAGHSFAEFDIFYTDFEQHRAASAWIDVIINEPAHKTIGLDEVVILRRARACL